MTDVQPAATAATPLLSISIPTYNRAGFLPDLLASIEREWDPRIEVVISDNASTDNTPALLEEWRTRLPRLKIVRQSENIGPDRNFLAVVSEATASFCWLFGSDDAVAPGAIATMLRALEDHPDIAGLSVNYTAHSYDFGTKLRTSHDPDFSHTRQLCGPEEVFSQIGHHLGFLSGQVVRRSLWLEKAACPESRDFYAGYIHVYLIGRMLEDGACWLMLADRLVRWRTGNDSFLTNGRLRRMRIDVEGYGAIGATLFGYGSAIERRFRGHVAAIHISNALLTMRRANDWDPATRKDARALLQRYYRDIPAYRRYLLPLLYLPTWLLCGATQIRRRIRRT